MTVAAAKINKASDTVFGNKFLQNPGLEFGAFIIRADPGMTSFRVALLPILGRAGECERKEGARQRFAKRDHMNEFPYLRSRRSGHGHTLFFSAPAGQTNTAADGRRPGAARRRGLCRSTAPSVAEWH